AVAHVAVHAAGPARREVERQEQLGLGARRDDDVAVAVGEVVVARPAESALVAAVVVPGEQEHVELELAHDALERLGTAEALRGREAWRAARAKPAPPPDDDIRRGQLPRPGAGLIDQRTGHKTPPACSIASRSRRLPVSPWSLIAATTRSRSSPSNASTSSTCSAATSLPESSSPESTRAISAFTLRRR